MTIKRKLKTPKDPVMKKGAAVSTSAVGRKKKPAAPAAAAPAAKKPAAKKPAAKKDTRTASEKKFDSERSAHLRKQRKVTKTKTLEQRLKDRLAAYKKNLGLAKKRAGTARRLLAARQGITRKNLLARQRVIKANTLARIELRLKARAARKPQIKGNKIVVPKVAAPKFKPKPMPKPLPMPRIKDGKIVTAPRPKSKPRAGGSAAAKKAAKTRGAGKAVEA